jgi:hypothetical protein
VKPQSIAAINQLPLEEQIEIYSRFIPKELTELLKISSDFLDENGVSLLEIKAEKRRSDAIIELKHNRTAKDPVLFAHITDTLNLQIHVLLYIMNDPSGDRFDVDRMPDGTPTEFGTAQRNIPAEIASMNAGLAPGQIRRGLHLFQESVEAFERFVTSLGHDLYLADPLYYHNAVIFEVAGFSYLKGRRFMQQIDDGFQLGEAFAQKLDGSSPFRQPEMGPSICGRSWAIHDGVLGEPFTDVTMYKTIGKSAKIATFSGDHW